MLGTLLALGLIGAISGGVGALANWGINAHEADKARDFEAEQAQINRDFNSAEADKARAFQEEQRATAYQDTVKDMEAAGLNPAAMYGSFSGASGAYSTTAASAPGVAGGNAASVGGNALSGVQGMISTAFMLNKLKQTPGGTTALKEIVQSMSFSAEGNPLGSVVKKTFSAM